MTEQITITHSTEADASKVWRLALLDGQAVADPFRPTADVVDLLRLHARHEEVAA